MRKLINGVLVGCLFYFLALGMKELFLFLNAEKTYQVLKEETVQIATDNQENEEAVNPFHRDINFEALNKINEEIVGWIYIPETKVDYPVLIGDTEQEYLKQDFEGKENALGSIFAFPNVELNQDFHVCLYGHNMISGQMFGGLKLYKEEKYAKTYRKAYLYTKESIKELELISVFQCENTDEIFELEEKTWEQSKAEEIVGDLQKRSFVETEFTQKKVTQIFTLVTCHGNAGGIQRLVLNFGVTKEKLILQ